MRSEETNLPRLVTAAFIGLFLPWVCVADVWKPGNEPYAGSIHTPQDGDVFACGAPVVCACSGATDWDVWTTEGECPFSGEALDLMSLNHPLWVASHGSFKDGDNIGLSVTWIAPGSPTSGISFQYYDEDRPKEIGPYDSGTRDDIPPHANGFLQDTVSGVETIIPDVNQVWFGYVPGQPDERHDINDVNRPEYNRNPPNNDPACYTMGSRAYATVRFWHAKTLDQVVDVNVYGATVGDGNNIGSWDMSLLVSRWQTNWEISQASGCIAVEPINNSIESHKYDTQWYYWCPEGLFAWIPSTHIVDSNLYAVYGGPLCPQEDYIKKNINWACGRAHGETTVIDIADKIHVALGGDPPMDINECDPCELSWDWDLLEGCPYYGECDEQAESMCSVLELLGVGGAYVDYVYASEDAGVGHCTTLDSRWDGDEHQWLIMDFAVGSGESPNACEGVAVVLDEQTEDHWYAVWPSYKATDDYDMLKKLPCEQWWVTTFADRYPGHPDGWAVQYWREQIPKP